jgi:hypothetical protein
MKKSTFLAIAASATSIFLTACGGGGSSAAPVTSITPVTPVTPAAPSFALQAGYKARVASGSATNFSISGTCSGSATQSSSAPTTATFEGVSAQAVTSTMSLNFTNCTPTSAASTSVGYYDSNYNPLGHSSQGVEYGKYLTIPTALPVSVKVGDTAVFGTETIYSDSSKQTVKGQRALSYVIESDGTSNSTAIANLITKDFNAANQPLFTQQSRYRIATDGKLTALSIDVQYSTTSTNHLLFTAN